MTPTVTALGTTITVARTVEQLPVAPGIWAVRWTDTTTRTVRKEGKVTAKTTQDVVIERVMTDGQLDVVLKGDNPELKPKHQVLSAVAVEIVRRNGYDALSNVFGGRGVPSKQYQPWFDMTSHHTQMAYKDAYLIATQPFTHVATHGLGDAQVVQIDHESHPMLRVDGVALPTMLVGDYIGGHFDEAHYDLAKAAAHLLARDDVAVLNDQPHRGRTHPVARNVNDAILTVPDYNSEPGRRRSIAFRWAPTQQEWDAVQAQATNGHGFCGSEIWKAVFDLDLLGLRACGAALFDDFYQAKEAEPDYDD